MASNIFCKFLLNSKSDNTNKVVFFFSCLQPPPQMLFLNSKFNTLHLLQKRYLLLWIALSSFLPVKAQVYFFNNETAVQHSGTAVTAFVDTSENRTLARYRSIQKSMQPLSQLSSNLNYKNEMLWLRVPLSVFDAKLPLTYLMVRNPHINFVGAWLMQGDSVIKAFPLTGDHLPFKSRSAYFTDYIFPLPDAQQNLSMLLLLDKRNEQINIPIHGLTDGGLSNYNRKKNLLAGLIIGLSLFLFLFSSFLYYNMREKLYVYYGLYIVAGFLYIFSDYGYLFMYFFPSNPLPADFTRPLSISLATPLYMLFTLQLLNVKQQLPVYYKWSVRYLLVYLFFFTVSLFFLPQSGFIRITLVFMMQIFQNLTAIMILLMAIIGWRKKILYAPYIVVSSLVLLFSFFFFMLFVSGLLPDTFFTRNLMNVGFVTELTILAFVLTLRFKSYKQQIELFLRQTNQQQEQIFKSISDYQEKEMQRLSSLLHDSVGARLSAVRFNLETLGKQFSSDKEKDSLQQSVQDISNLADEVRNFSHNLSPLLLQKKGLVAAISEFVASINKQQGLYIQFESIGSLQKVSFRYELLLYNVLQELIQNIIKHSNATDAIVQLILEKEVISVFVEDNGSGFDQRLIKEGLGFTQIKQLVTFVNGSLSIDAQAGSGCKISIEFPVLQDETSNPTAYSR